MRGSSFVCRVCLVRRDVSGVSSRCRVFGAGGGSEESCVCWKSSHDVERGLPFCGDGYC
jgi:hypothetical protein